MAVFGRKGEKKWSSAEVKTALAKPAVKLETLQVAPEAPARVKVRVFPQEEMGISEQMSFKHNALVGAQPYSHMLYFGGEAAFTSKQYLVRLLNVLEASRQPDPARAVIAAVANSTLEGVFVTRRFMESSSETSHSLAAGELTVGATRDAEETVRRTVKAAHRSGAPLDFSYKAEDQPIGIRRANVVKRYHDYFIGEHHRGQRRYRYDRVIEAQADGSVSRFVSSEPAATVTFSVNGVGSVRLLFGSERYVSAGALEMLSNLRLQRQELDQRIKELELKIKRAKRKA